MSQVKKGRTTTEAGSKAREVLAEVASPGTDRRYTEGRRKGGKIKKLEVVWLVGAAEVLSLRQRLSHS